MLKQCILQSCPAHPLEKIYITYLSKSILWILSDVNSLRQFTMAAGGDTAQLASCPYGKK